VSDEGDRAARGLGGDTRTFRVDQELLRLLVAETRDYAILLLDERGTVITWNAGAERIKGYRAPEII
jgi:PAS domain S-box-containing protein